MGRLGNLFSEADKHDYVDRHLRPGQVLYLFCQFTNPPKEKYVVLTYAGPTPLLLVINSRISPFIEHRPELRRCQVKLNASDYDFLDHDSFADCSKVIDSLDKTNIREQVLADLGRAVGELTQATKREIIKAVQDAKTISNHHKRLIIDALTS
jgi:hypothetical protein